MKTCPQCGETKPTAEFGKSKSRPDGLRHVCRACNNAAARKWGKENPDKARAQAAKWTKNNPERRREIALKYTRTAKGQATRRTVYEKNRASVIKRAIDYNRTHPKKKAAAAKKWKVRNKARVTADTARRNGLRLKATPAWLTAIQLAQIQEFYEVALARTVQTGIEHHVDHIHPLRGANFRGLHVPWNLQVLIAEENLRKGARQQW